MFPLEWYFSHADALCSARPKCEIPTPTLIFHFKPCPVELSAFLEASYKCVPGIYSTFQLLQSFANKVLSPLKESLGKNYSIFYFLGMQTMFAPEK